MLSEIVIFVKYLLSEYTLSLAKQKNISFYVNVLNSLFF